MRLARRILSLLALLGTIVVLIRYRANVESKIIEKTFDAVAYAHAVEEEAASRLATFQLPQVILPFHGGSADNKDKDKDKAKPSPSDSSRLPTSSSTSKRPGVQPIITTEKGEDGGEIRDVGALWAKWSKIMYESRPNITKINLNGRAQTSNPQPGSTVRKPYRDYVRASNEDIESMRDRHARYVDALEETLGDGQRNASQRQWKGLDIFKGRGIVMVGGGEYFGPAIISLHMLRRTGSTLPVEVFVPNDDEYEEEVCEKYLKKLDAKCVVLSHILDKSSLKIGPGDLADMKITHYQLKSLALLLSSFSDTLLLDSDSIPLYDPTKAIFDVEPYKSKGMIVWPDFWKATESPKFWTIAGRSSFPEDLPATASEAGQLAVNKATHLAPLLLATYYNIFGPDHYYPLLSQGALGQGDKETFMAAAVNLNSTFYRVKTSVDKLSRHSGLTEKGTAMVQHSSADDYRYLSSSSSSSPPIGNSIKPLFIHCNTPKMNAGHLVDEGDLLDADGSTRLRLLGSKEDLSKKFGFDVEQSLWDLLVQTGCELQGKIEEWKERPLLCERLQEHHEAIFGSSF